MRTQRIESRPNTHTHRTGFAACVEHATPNLVWLKKPNRVGDQIDFRVGRGIAVGSNSVPGSEHYSSVQDQECSEGMVPSRSASRAKSIACRTKPSLVLRDSMFVFGSVPSTPIFTRHRFDVGHNEARTEGLRRLKHPAVRIDNLR